MTNVCRVRADAERAWFRVRTTLVDVDGRDGTTAQPTARVRLAAAGVALILDVPDDALPTVVHWGADPGPLSADELATATLSTRPPFASNGVDAPLPVALLPEGWTGWTGTPGLSGHRRGADWSPRFQPTSVVVESREDVPGGHLEIHAVDALTHLGLSLRVEMLASGLVRLRAALENTGDTPYTLDALQLALPIPTRADEVLDLAGRWAKERVPQRRAFTVGAHTREGRHGRTGADAATLLIAAESSVDFDRGDAWGVHVAFSGNHRSIAERAFTGERLLYGGELLLPGEVELEPGDSYETPWVYGAYGHGLDEVAARFHDHLRARPTHPRTARPVVMNVWEAVYFEHDLERILPLVELAARVGVERFVLDDGWFGSRRDDRSGLGDWTVAEEVWGDGRFAQLVAAVKDQGMEFGLWFEPEMVNLDSDVARAHPEWLLQVPGRLPVEARHQQVLDLTHPEAFEHIRRSIVTLVQCYAIDFIKWDHNRDLVDAGSTRTGRAGVHAQTLAAYRLLDEIRLACPGLEIESCSSGGARVDLGILERTDRVWASDCIDPRERQQIQRWTAQLLPPELVGSHIGAERAHTTGRKNDLSFRAATALFGSLGVEWDLSRASADELEELAAWIAFYKQTRHLVHTGRVVRRSLEGGDVWMTAAIGRDQSEALYQVVLRERHVTWPVGAVRLPGLRAETRYRVRAAGPDAGSAYDPRIHPAWWVEGLTATGAMLGEIGVQVPALAVDHAVHLHVEELS